MFLKNADKSPFTLDKATVDTIMYKHFVRMFENTSTIPTPFEMKTLYSGTGT